MSNLYEDLKEGLTQAVDYEKGLIKAKKNTYYVSPVENYDNNQIREIRMKSGMTQQVFANYLGVSVKTIEAWECGRTHPTGPASRLISILDKNQINKLDFIQIK